MHLVEVKTKKDKKDFLLFPLSIYRDDKNWVRPLDRDIEQVFDEKKNKFFRHGKCIRWLLKDNLGEIKGRVAAFINNKTANKNDQPTGGMGFFECVKDKNAAFMLFDGCKNWLSENGMQAMDGPINFGERDSWWGLMVEGYSPPPYKMNYNPPYYKDFFEAYGFKVYFNQLCYSLDPQKRTNEKFYERHKLIADNKNYKSEYIDKSKIEKFAEDFRIVYNKAWVRHGGGKELDSKQVQVFFKKMKPVIDEKIIWFVYYKNEPVACWINLPDINQAFKKFNGRFGLIEKIRFMIMLKRRQINRCIGLVFGIIPEHQGKGVDGFLIVEGANMIQKEKLYTEYEMQWVGDFNPRMIAVAESLGTWRSRVLTTYRFLFDRNKEFKRHPVI